MSENDSIQSILDHAFQLKKSGRPVAEILALFPNQHTELKEFLETISAIHYGTNEMNPAPEALSKAITKIKSSAVTNKSRARYTLEEQKERRPFAIYAITNKIAASFKNRLTLFIPLGVIVLIGIFIGFRLMPNNGSAVSIDDEISLLTNDSSGEYSELTSEGDEALNIITSGNESLAELSQSYDETQF